MCRSAFTVTLAGVLAAACGSSATGPSPDLCSVQNGAEVCVTRSQYRPTQFVDYTVTNTTAAPIFKDGCSLKVVGVTNLENPFEAVFNPTLQCGAGTLADIVANMIELAPGQMIEETIQISPFAFQGYYRVNVWILDETGMLAANVPATSGIFEIFPSAD